MTTATVQRCVFRLQRLGGCNRCSQLSQIVFATNKGSLRQAYLDAWKTSPSANSPQFAEVTLQWNQLWHASSFGRLHFSRRNEYQADLRQSRIRSRELEMPLLCVFSLPRHSVVCFHPCFCQNLGSRARHVLFTSTKHSSSKATGCIKLWETLLSSKLTAKMLLKITRPTFSVRHFLRLKVAATNSVKEKSCSCGEKPTMSQSESDVKLLS